MVSVPSPKPPTYMDEMLRDDPAPVTVTEPAARWEGPAALPMTTESNETVPPASMSSEPVPECPTSSCPLPLRYDPVPVTLTEPLPPTATPMRTISEPTLTVPPP